jgi:hypothetical protein
MLASMWWDPQQIASENPNFSVRVCNSFMPATGFLSGLGRPWGLDSSGTRFCSQWLRSYSQFYSYEQNIEGEQEASVNL